MVVHSPDTEVFDDLPSMPTRSHNNSIVCWMDETLCWRPESTSISLLLRVSDKSCSERNDDLRQRSKPQPNMRPCVPRCVWNHLVLAFHLPDASRLEIPDHVLLRNLMPCHVLQPFLNDGPIQKYQARERIRTFYKNIGSSPLDCRYSLQLQQQETTDVIATNSAVIRRRRHGGLGQKEKKRKVYTSHQIRYWRSRPSPPPAPARKIKKRYPLLQKSRQDYDRAMERRQKKVK